MHNSRVFDPCVGSYSPRVE